MEANSKTSSPLTCQAALVFGLCSAIGEEDSSITGCRLPDCRQVLRLYNQLLKYEVIIEVVARSALKAFKRHIWYLTEEMVPLALFREATPPEERQALPEILLAIKPKEPLTRPTDRFGTGFGKPEFPENVIASTKLADLVGQDSWFFFYILKLEEAFLTERVVDWVHHTAYKECIEHVQAFIVINDCAERGVKLSSDFISLARS